jgi:hypothetical protein
MGSRGNPAFGGCGYQCVYDHPIGALIDLSCVYNLEDINYFTNAIHLVMRS